MTSSVHCKNFIQNAWKRDLCSNCFKSKEEHTKAGPLPVPTVILQPPKEGILKGSKTESRPPKRNKVLFQNESEVIGYGGEDSYSSEDESFPDYPTEIISDEVYDNEEDKAFQRLTKSNTDFNSIPENLQQPKDGEIKKVVEPLKLGKQIVDGKGNKKTLLVSVTPFGAQNDSPAKTKSAGNISDGKVPLNNLKQNFCKSLPEIYLSKENSNTTTDFTLVGISKKTENVQNESLLNVGPNNVESNVYGSTENVKHDSHIDAVVAAENYKNTCANENVELTKRSLNEKYLKRSQPLDKNSKYRPCTDRNDDIEKSEFSLRSNPNEESKTDISEGKEESSHVETENVNGSKLICNVIGQGKKIENEVLSSVEAQIKFPTINYRNSIDKDSNKVDTDKKETNEIKNEDCTKNAKLTNELKNSFLSTELKINASILNIKKEPVISLNNPAEKSTEDKTDNPPVQSTNVVKPVPNMSSLYRSMNFNNKTNVQSLKRFLQNDVSDNLDSNAQLKTNEDHTNSSVDIIPTIVCNFSEKSSIDDKELLRKDESDISSNVLKDYPFVHKVPTYSKCSNKLSSIENDNLDTCKIIDDEKINMPNDIKNSFSSFENFERMMKGEEVTIFSVEDSRRSVSSVNSNEVKFEDSKNYNENMTEFSRESAGEPDGRADSDDLSEPPALPMSPPPAVDPRTSFLHALTMSPTKKCLGEKPKVPAKPVIIQSKRTNFQSITPTSKPTVPVELFSPPSSEIQNGDSVRTPKRQAPKPPSPKDESTHIRSIEGKEEIAEVDNQPQMKDDVVEEKDMIAVSNIPEEICAPSTPVLMSNLVGSKDKVKQERRSRSSENILELVQKEENVHISSVACAKPSEMPEPSTKRSLSLSQDSLISSGIGEVQEKKKTSRGRFSLRKLLHLGKYKETKEYSTISISKHREIDLPPIPKPRLEIIHPFDLNGAKVEVVPPVRPVKSRRSSSSASSSSGEQRESDIHSDSSASQSVCSSGNDSQLPDRPKKPPPPPRNQSLDNWNKHVEAFNKPVRLPPPRSGDIERYQPSTWVPVSAAAADNFYANLGEARIGLAPTKPVRTASMREIKNEAKVLTTTSQPEDSGYESFDVSLNTVQSHLSSLPNEENVYECVQVTQRSSSPECDLTIPGSPNYSKLKRFNNRYTHHRRSDGSVDLSTDYTKFKFIRSVSLPYCGSETESEIYSPFSFCGSELGEEDFDISSTSGHSLRMSRLKLKKGRSVVHKNLEDNYGAVIVANHQALAQVVEQMHQGPVAPLALRPLTTVANLRWSDFVIAKETAGVVADKRVFYSALWGLHAVTLSLIAEQGIHCSLQPKGSFSLNPLTEFSDLVPASYLQTVTKNDSDLVQASISVLAHLHVETLQTYGLNLRASPVSEDIKKECNFVLLQIINALKSLQAQGIEEAPMNLSNMILCREDRDPQPRLCILQCMDRSSSEGSKGSLCQCAMIALTDILPVTNLTDIIADILRQEKAVSLSQAKCILEFSLWGPADIAFVSCIRDRELALQRWLDLERATVLHGLVRTRAELTVFEEWHLMFLVRTNGKMMAEASVLLNPSLAGESTN